MKYVLSEYDPFIIRLYPKDEGLDIYGQEYLDEFGYEVPQELADRYESNYKEFINIQQELRKYYEVKR